jgi:hypothetical protein
MISGEFFTIFGLILVLIGSFVAARAIIVTHDAAIKIAGQVRTAPREQFLQFGVRNLVSQSRSARNGLYLVFAGTAFQLVGWVVAATSYH